MERAQKLAQVRPFEEQLARSDVSYASRFTSFKRLLMCAFFRQEHLNQLAAEKLAFEQLEGDAAVVQDEVGVLKAAISDHEPEQFVMLEDITSCRQPRMLRKL